MAVYNIAASAEGLSRINLHRAGWKVRKSWERTRLGPEECKQKCKQTKENAGSFIILRSDGSPHVAATSPECRRDVSMGATLSATCCF